MSEEIKNNSAQNSEDAATEHRDYYYKNSTNAQSVDDDLNTMVDDIISGIEKENEAKVLKTVDDDEVMKIADEVGFDNSEKAADEKSDEPKKIELKVLEVSKDSANEETELTREIPKEPKKEEVKEEPKKASSEIPSKVLKTDKPAHTDLNQKFQRNLEEKKIDAPLAQNDKDLESEIDEATKIIDLKISEKYKTKVIPNTDQLDIDDEVENAELKKRRQEKINDFVLIRDGEEDEDEYEDDEEEYTDISQARQIFRRLNNFKTGICLRLFVLVITSFSLFYISFAYDNETLYLPQFISKSSPVGYISFNAILGLISCMVSLPVIIGGFKKLFTLKADEDSASALSLLCSILVPLYFLFKSEDININNIVLYVSVAVAGLLFNTIGKLINVNRIINNFSFISGTAEKYIVKNIEDEEIADEFTKGLLVDFPQLSVKCETEFLTDFLKISGENTHNQKVGRILVPLSVVLALGISIGCYFIYNDISLALSAFVGTVCVASPFSFALLTAMPLSRASSKGINKASLVNSYRSAERFADTNSVLINANDLFPDGSIRLVAFKIFGNKKPDDAVLYASSLCIHAKSVLSHIFYDIIDGNVNMLRNVENFVYEDSMGMSAWIDNKRILMGSRELMKNHGITIPTIESERKYLKNDDIKVVYLSVSGEVYAVFHIEMKASIDVADQIARLERNKISIMIKTVDSVITVSNIAEIFDIYPNNLKILPFRLHSDFDKVTSYVPEAECTAVCDGKFPSFAAALVSSKKIRKSVRFATTVHIASLILGVLLFGGFALLSAVGYFTPSSITIFYFAWAFLISVIGLDV